MIFALILVSVSTLTPSAEAAPSAKPSRKAKTVESKGEGA